MGIKLHSSITLDRVQEAVQRQMCSLDDPGFCVACGEEVMGVEPDARKYECESCGAMAVYGAAELLLMGVPSIGADSVEGK